MAAGDQKVVLMSFSSGTSLTWKATFDGWLVGAYTSVADANASVYVNQLNIGAGPVYGPVGQLNLPTTNFYPCRIPFLQNGTLTGSTTVALKMILLLEPFVSGEI